MEKNKSIWENKLSILKQLIRFMTVLGETLKSQLMGQEVYKDQTKNK